MSKGSFLSASIGRKFFMSITGLFLITFIIVHMSINLLLIFDESGELFNIAAHFMATNPLIKVMEPILALGFLVHIVWSVGITIQNMRARPVGYNKTSQSVNSTWTSRNMFILGGLVLVFLGLHLFNFWWKIKIVGDPLLEHITVMQGGIPTEMENTYLLVSTLFKESIIYCLIYIAGGILLGLHVTHGFWSAFQTIGLNNQIWRKRFYVLANIIGWIFAIGFSVIPLYFMIKF
ncbi:MAG: succinate dehydrogenase cytochrome b subunit [Prolixibacteraceae bacterium]|jgi:succinate dehydrogenase / fumarate reductase cytochrome b subunit|nr:succinate dehydrogenase cytochrome b subunit [Prolixibacteraceae bacterium]